MLSSSISVVIPTRNAAATLPACLRSLEPGAALIREIIVVDGGSTDATTSLAAGAAVISAPPGRGGQLRAGVLAGSGTFLLLLHADTELSPDWPQAVAGASPELAFYFRFRLNSPRRAARILEAIVRRRCRWLSLPYGDQGLLISQALLHAIGGVPGLPIMEDVALARRLRGRLRELPAVALTSAARYEREGYLRRPLRNLVCLALYSCGMPPGMIARLYG